ncbi:MAG: hypothetical protein K2M95_06565, partial [Clostridiales bacterium]|nr:hypothetical protein [Clostridiales bacterium]
MNTKKSKWLSIFLATAMLLSTLLFTGCFDLFNIEVSGVQFTSERIDLAVGQRIDLSSYVEVLPSKASKKEFNVLSSDEDVVKIETYRAGGVVAKVYAYAVGLGEATLTAVTVQNDKTATVTVKVSYATPTGIAIVPASSLNYIENQNTVIVLSDAVAPISFTASLSESESVDPQENVVWSYGGNETTQSADLPFSVTPQGVGSTTLSVSVAADPNVNDSVFINVVDAVTSVEIAYDESLLVQEPDEYKTVTFTLSYVLSSENNPAPIIEWFVNGESAGSGKNFAYTPTRAGLYKIEVKVNGEYVEFANGELSVTVQARGYLQSQRVTLDYDNCYPKVFIRWSGTAGAAGFAVSIQNTRTGETLSDLSTENVALRDKFTDSSFDATAYFNNSFGKVFTDTFIIKVKTLGDESGILTESAWSAPYTTSRVDTAAIPYLEKTFYSGARNYYVRSDEEFFEWVEYAFLWRPSSLSTGETLYLDYSYGTTGDPAYTAAQRVIANAIDKAAFTGSYGFNGFAQSNRKICKFTIDFHTEGTPSKRTSGHDEQQWNAIRPHVNYDPSKVRSANFAFPIDAKTPVEVSTSEQLYYIAMLGYKPVPTVGSPAATLYAYARRTLRYIISNDMTDVQKLHAIYDWILWRVLYDYEVLDISRTEEAVKYESYYLESILTDTDYYGVCDAMSKAYTLLASIEGFECLRVIGEAGPVGNRGGHAWNKVKLDGQWYIVDCTWGDVNIQLVAGGAVKEGATHQYFLITDEMVAADHIEEDGITYPATASTRYPWYDEEFETDSLTVDFHIEGSLTQSKMTEEVADLVSYMLEDMQNTGVTYTVGASSTNTYAEYYGYEIIVDKEWKATFNNKLGSNPLVARSPLVSALSNVNLTLNRDYYLDM